MIGNAIRDGRAAESEILDRRERRRALEERLATDPTWRQDRRRLAAIFRDPALGLPLAGTLAEEAPWRVVADAAADVRVLAGVRQALDRALARRVKGLSSGERVALARLAGPKTRQALGEIADGSLLEALSQHPRIGARERAGLRARLVSLRVASQPAREADGEAR